MTAFHALVAGLVFGTGLIVSGMSNPAKVLAFLDLAGRWDPSLAVVMAASIPVAALGYAIANRRGTTLFGGTLSLPTTRDIDRPLVIGALVFGIGWGFAGICPGPAVTLAGAGRAQGIVFVAAMLAGMGMFELAQRWRATREAAQPARSMGDA